MLLSGRCVASARHSRRWEEAGTLRSGRAGQAAEARDASRGHRRINLEMINEQ